MVSANGLEFEVFEAGEGEKLALCLHGFPQHAICWRRQIATLLEKNYRVWAVNQRGYGRSSRPDDTRDYGFDDLTGDVAALIDAAGATRVSLLGHDWGGVVTYVFASRGLRPIERLVTVNAPHPVCFFRALSHWEQRLRSWYVGFFQLPFAPERLLSVNHAAIAETVFRATAKNKDAFTPEAMTIYRDNISQPGAAKAMIDWYRTAGRVTGIAGLKNPIAAPTLAIWGEQDFALTPYCLDGLERYAPDLQIKRLAGASHWCLEDAAPQVNALLSEFL